MNPQPTLIEEDCIADSGSPTSRRGSLTTEQLCERLEKRCVLISNGGGAYLLTSTPDQDCAEAATTLRAQAAEIERLNARNVEVSVLAHAWMVAHDMRAAGMPVTYPARADVPALTARVEALETVLRKSAEGWANIVELRLILPQHITSATILRDEARAALQGVG